MSTAVRWSGRTPTALRGGLWGRSDVGEWTDMGGSRRCWRGNQSGRASNIEDSFGVVNGPDRAPIGHLGVPHSGTPAGPHALTPRLLYPGRLRPSREPARRPPRPR
ncbi:hypothetical protein GCM10027075_45320 [Streptomyces heilongjiangensis]